MTDHDEVEKLRALGRAAAVVIDHPKFSGAGQLASWLWLRGLAYLTTNQVDGVISEDALRKLTPNGKRLSAVLVAVGLWKRVDGGWRMRSLASAPPAPAPRTVTPPEGTEVLRFYTVGVGGPGYWPLTDRQIAAWSLVYPALDVKAECLKARAWIEADLQRRKTYGGMPRFLVRWLNRSSDRPKSSPQDRGRTGAPPPGKYDHLKGAQHD